MIHSYSNLQEKMSPDERDRRNILTSRIETIKQPLRNIRRRVQDAGSAVLKCRQVIGKFETGYLDYHSTQDLEQEWQHKDLENF